MIVLLLIGSGLYLLLGELGDAIPLLFSTIAVMLLNIYEENKAEKALKALKELGSPKAYVIRDGEVAKIPSREVVVGDHLLINEGDFVAADARVVQATNLTTDEALLTGESVTVPKIEGAQIFMGTMVATGHGLAVVSQIGQATEIGKIGSSLEEIKMESSPAKKEAAKLTGILAVFGLSLCLILVLLYGLTQGNWLAGLLAGITLAMSLLPEEIPVVITIFTIMGAYRMSKHRLLTKRSSVIETLGAATVICLDKTGTITQNKMVVTKLYAAGQTWDVGNTLINQAYDELIKFAVLACHPHTVDPMEKAIGSLGAKLWGTQQLFADWKHLSEVPITEKVLAVSEVWEDLAKTQVTAIKGAPEAIINLCPLNFFEKEALDAIVASMAEEGLRVMGVAKNISGQTEFVGLLGFSDPIRPAIKEAVAQSYSAGVRVVIITGDHLETAKRVGAEIGLKHHQQCLTGAHIKEMDETAVRKAVKSHNIFARITPSQKLLLIDALKQNGEIVAMVGDGVNDAPAIKSAHIGIAMGEKGTDVARAASSLVLLDDNFASVVTAIKQGRRIYDNIKKAIGYVVAMHFPIAGMAIIPIMLGYPPVLLPIHIALLEIFIDPACSIVFESQPEEANIMKRSPRQISEKLVNLKTIVGNVFQGIVALTGVYLSFLLTTRQELASDQVRTATFLTLLVISVGLVLINHSWHRVTFSTDAPLIWFVATATLCVLVAPNIGWLREFVKLGSLDWQNQVVAITFGLGVTLFLGFVKNLPKIAKYGRISTPLAR